MFVHSAWIQHGIYDIFNMASMTYSTTSQERFFCIFPALFGDIVCIWCHQKCQLAYSSKCDIDLKIKETSKDFLKKTLKSPLVRYFWQKKICMNKLTLQASYGNVMSTDFLLRANSQSFSVQESATMNWRSRDILGRVETRDSRLSGSRPRRSPFIVPFPDEVDTETHWLLMSLIVTYSYYPDFLTI